jgi:hypothetical protein
MEIREGLKVKRSDLGLWSGAPGEWVRAPYPKANGGMEVKLTGACI